MSPPPFTGNNPLTPGPSASRRARGEYSVSPSFFTSISTKGRTENPLLISLSLGEVPEGRVRGPWSVSGANTSEVCSRFRPAIRLLGVVLAVLTCAGGTVSASLAQRRAPPIILISVDTLRADRLGCYGYRGQPTSHIDSLTQGGTLFAQVSSQVPLTLPSHVSLLTSTYPFSSGIVDNGQRLGPNAVTLASVLKTKGYRTAAFVGGFVLDRRFGLNQGFDFYDSPFDLRHQKTDPGEVKRWGDEVVGAATEWLNRNSDVPFFAFLHLYDLHTPYELPSSRHNRLRGRLNYDTQLAYVDEVFGDFLKYLTEKGLFQKTLIIFTSDHGEGLGDHGESTHGYFIYQSTLRVPLIIHWPLGGKRFPDRVEEPTRLLDVAPSIVQFAGLTNPEHFQGQSLLGVLNENGSSRAAREIYGESLYASRHFGCSVLRSLQLGHFKYIEAPKPELYDLSKDPGESQNLYNSEKSMTFSLRERLLAFRSRFRAEGQAESQALSPETVAALSSLGYIAASNPTVASSTSKPDPKDRIREFENQNHAIALASSGQLAQSNSLLRQLHLKLPDVTDILLSLGVNQQRLGNHREAAESFREVLKSDSLNVLAHFDLAVSLSELRQFDGAIKELQVVLRLAPYYTRADELLGRIWLQRQDYSRARDCFNHLLQYAPEDYGAHYNLGALATLQGNWDEAEQHLNLALAVDPNSSEANNTLGSLFLRRGELDRAREAFLKTIALDGSLAGPHYNLGLVLRQQKRNEEAAQAFRQALAVDPQFRPAREALERLESVPK